ncbi:SEC-C domain-containing protein [bacterium]|nr:SEC-C domain-containing protein [bacterium]
MTKDLHKENKFDGKKPAKLGTPKNPAIVQVQNKKRMKEVAAVFEENGWEYEIHIDPKKPENLTDLEILSNPVETIHAEQKVGRNDPCPCGSGKKYKHCCENKS